MREGRPSFTAAWVAACRAAGPLLPDEARLCDDPFGARFATPEITRVRELALRHADGVRRVLDRAPRLARNVTWIQLRTRVLDDVVRAFVRAGGDQVLLLGAGFDCRAARLDELAHATVYEVDHPATQQRKRALLDGAQHGGAAVRYLAWNFERDPMPELPSRLAAIGHDARRPTLTIWEGVTMYLDEPAIDATVRAVARLSAPGSPFAITYFDRARLDHPPASLRLFRRFVALVGEPWRFGWRPSELPAWLAPRGFSIDQDRDAAEMAREHLPPRWSRIFTRDTWRHIAVARRS